MDPQELLLTAGRATLVYFFLLLVVRLLGKREIGSISAFDLIVALILGEVVGDAIFGDGTLLQGGVAITVVAVWHYANSWASYKSPLISRITGGKPTVLVEKGKVLHDALAKERLNEEELYSEMRINSIGDIKEVKVATLETNGQISFVKEEWAQELQKGDLPKKKGK
jgi:uncharacterized membrane protein YcaP (DUF421 family)